MNHIVLFHPEIPQNTGNIMRTAMATESKLHIIGPLPFTLNDETIKRTGLDYRDHLQYSYYDSYQDFMDKNHHPILHCLTRYGDKIYTEITVKNKVDDVYHQLLSLDSYIKSQTGWYLYYLSCMEN
jgi:tRNA (cytidine/uridine-2'-O-)-methyltransferase